MGEYSLLLVDVPFNPSMSSKINRSINLFSFCLFRYIYVTAGSYVIRSELDGRRPHILSIAPHYIPGSPTLGGIAYFKPGLHYSFIKIF